MRQISVGTVVVCLAVQAGCAWPDPSGNWDVPREPPATTPTPTPPPTPVDPPTACGVAPGIGYEQPRPNVMLLVDRSGSMSAPGGCAAGSCPSKWQQLLALGGYLADVKQHARLGLTVFPSLEGEACSVGAGTMVPLSDADDVDAQILDSVARIAPGGRTPIAAALDALTATGALDDPTRDNVIVLLTDGQPNCTCEGDDADCEREEAIAAVTRLADRPVPVTLDVVGFGASATAASATLSAMAETAGSAIPGPVSYFQAETVEQLIGRLYQVAAGLAPCRFLLDELPAEDALVVHVDDGEAEACADAPCLAGYSYDRAGGVVELHGETCEAIRDGGCHNVWFESR